MRPNHQRTWIVVAVLAILSMVPAQAAKLVKGQSGLCDWKLDGEIAAGDAERVAATIDSTTTICLNSPGGSWIEGLALFRHFADTKIHTVVLGGDLCASACALAFMGGADGGYGDRYPKRSLRPGARLGFHSPFIPETADRQASLAQGVAVGISVVAGLLRADQYKLMPTELIANMLETGPDKLFYIDTLAKAKQYKIDIDGVPVPKTITTAMLYQACVNSDPWQSDVDTAVDPKTINRRAVSDKPNIYRVEFGPGFSFQGMESCAVSTSKPRGEVTDLIVTIDYAAPGKSLLTEPPRKQDERPFWYLLPSSTRIFN